MSICFHSDMIWSSAQNLSESRHFCLTPCFVRRSLCCIVWYKVNFLHFQIKFVNFDFHTNGDCLANFRLTLCLLMAGDFFCGKLINFLLLDVQVLIKFSSFITLTWRCGLENQLYDLTIALMRGSFGSASRCLCAHAKGHPTGWTLGYLYLCMRAHVNTWVHDGCIWYI